MIIPSIQRYYIDERGIAKSDTGEWMRADEVNAIFKPEVAYVPVPRCDQCAHWKPFEEDLQPARVGGIVEHLKAYNLWPAELVLTKLGDCKLSTADESKMGAFDELPVATHHDFGCVQWKAKA